jgi:signal transduction histidine kinase
MYDLDTIVAFGVTFGIVAMTILYTFIRYVYSKEFFYIAYCLMQCFSLVFIIAYSQLFFHNSMLEQIALILATLSAIAFAIAFYEGRFFPTINDFKGLIINTLLLNVVILTSFYHYMVFEYLPYTVIYAILFISVIFNFSQGFQATMIYVIGWSVFCFVLFVMDFKSYYIQQDWMDIVLVAFALEAILFTLSVAYKYNDDKQQNKEVENMLLQQTRLAKSGQMIGNITHQFRQPLNNVSYMLMNVQKRFDNNALNKEYLYKKIHQATEQLQFMSKTIDDFKMFYSMSKHKENFMVKTSIDNAYSILSADMKKKNISFSCEFETSDSVMVHGIVNELSHVLFSLFSNAIEAFHDKQSPWIHVIVQSNEAEVIIRVKDNAGGIAKRNINKVFDAYFSTKEKGSGIGLYLVKIIIENSFQGKIEVQNQEEGACFTLFLEKSI